MQTRVYIDDDLYLDGTILYDGEREIKLGDPCFGRMLRFMVDNAEQDFSRNELYQGCFPGKKMTVDYDDRVDRIIQRLRGRHKKLKDCITTTKKGYIFHLPLRLKPDGAYMVPQYHIKREDVLEELMKWAFVTGNCFLIYGPPGMGKTELARDFAWQYSKVFRIYRNVFTVCYSKSLKHTVATIRTQGHTSVSPQYEDFLEKLKEMRKQGKLLLIVDNMDITPEAFAKDQEILEDLCGLDIQILFTSRNALTPWFDGISLELKPMGQEMLDYLFRSAAGTCCLESKERIIRLIREGLQDNTYLTVLSGKLLRRLESFDVLENALLNEGVETIRESVSIKKDGRFCDGMLMEHIQTLYSLSNLDEGQKELLSAMCLMPSGSMECRTFMDRAYGRGRERDEAERVLAVLEDSFWVVRSGAEGKLHPMVRDLILRELQVGRPFRAYVEATSRALYSREYEASLLTQLHFANTAWAVIEKRKLVIPETAFLLAQIASTWDTLTDYELSFAWSMRAIPLLDKVERQKLDAEKLHWLSLCYNVVGYALGHAREAVKAVAAVAAKHALENAEALTEQGLQHSSLTQETEEDLLVLRSKIHSNQAASCINTGDYAEAARRHRMVLSEREKLWECYRKEEYRELMAAAYKNIGTAQFYLAKQDLLDSWENHSRAMEIHSEESTKSEAYFIALHRAIGSFLRILEMSGDKEIRKRYLCTREELLLRLLLQQRDALKYLMEELPLAGEIRSGYDNACRILYHACQMGICSGDFLDAADQIWSLQYHIAEELRPDLQKKITKAIHPFLILLDKMR